ncbi:hypothetical protein [Pseudoalteromonas phage J2-1_QLiu-2017]|nr:hypothetical protein [Pseudoalteromonas phage J2-1_QLiu-2017]
MRVYGERIEITQETLLATNKHFADNKQACINEAVSGEVFVNNLEDYVKQCEERKQAYLSGDFDLWLGYWQQAYYIQSGACVPILAREEKHIN